jgi:hypothetical protein
VSRVWLWLIRVAGVPLINALIFRAAAYIRLKRRKARAKEVIENLKKADTPEERDLAAKDVINHFNDSDQ